MYPRAHLLGIPAELRLQIYRDYVTVPGGYRYNSSSNRLSTYDGCRIHLGLFSTCKLVADEMKGMALDYNTVTFSTLYSDDLRQCAGQFESVVTTARMAKTEFVFQMRGILSFAMRDDMARDFPGVQPILDQLILLSNSEMWGLWREAVDSNYTFGAVPSDFRDFATQLCQTMVNESKLLDNARFQDPMFPWEDLPPGYVFPAEVMEILTRPVPLNFKNILSIPDATWLIPTNEEVQQMGKDMDITTVMSHEDEDRNRALLGVDPCSCYTALDEWTRWRFSVAATAIRFLRSLPEVARRHLRRIVLLEDHESVAQPECHAQGLIPFCRENPLLQVERRINLWKCVLPRTEGGPWRVPFRRPLSVQDGVDSRFITREIAPWIAEACSLGSKGMPLGSFHLVLDGDIAPERATEVLSIVIRDASYESAMQQAHQQGLITDPRFYLHKTSGLLFFKNFPQAIDDLVRGTSSILSCNFDIVDFVDSEPILRKGQNWTVEEWDRNWAPAPSYIDTAPQLPTWKKLLEMEHPVGTALHMQPHFNVAAGRMLFR